MKKLMLVFVAMVLCSSSAFALDCDRRYRDCNDNCIESEVDCLFSNPPSSRGICVAATQYCFSVCQAAYTACWFTLPFATDDGDESSSSE